MMVWRDPVLLAILLACRQIGVVADPTWPASTDELEDLLYLNNGYRARGLSSFVTPCGTGLAQNRSTAAEWIRTAFHDMASGSTYSGAGGLDGSIMYELKVSDNDGPGFPDAITTFAKYYSSRLSLSDIIAASVYTATRSCGGPIIPVRGGRRDATAAGLSGQIPQPQNAIGTFRNQFLRMGYTTDADMIKFVACGHTLGGVHGATQPLIVAPGSAPPGDYVHMDSTFNAFDNKIATEYISSTTKNPLVRGLSEQYKRNSDKIVFQADNNATMTSLTDSPTFASSCQIMFQRMIELVPETVQLTDPVTPYAVKPYDLQLSLLSGGSKLQFIGDIRVQTTTNAATKVQLIYKNRSGSLVSTPIDTTHTGDATGFDDQFSFFGFSAEIPADTSISSFNILVTLSGGTTKTFDNNGNSFKVDDTVVFQSPQSCMGGSGKMSVVAAVRSGSSSPRLQVVVQNARASSVPVPTLSTATAAMASQSSVGAYQLYSADYAFTGAQAQSAEFGVFAGTASDNYKKASKLGTSCVPLDASTPTPTAITTTSTVLPNSSSTSSTLSSTPTPSPTSSFTPSSSAATPSSTAYEFQGCYTDPNNPRPLSAAATVGSDMTIDKCASFCSPYQFFGLEYGSECYCGNVLASNGVKADLSDCNMPCSGKPTEICGASSRLSFYKNLLYKPAGNAVIPGYSYAGCYSEASGGIRALSDSATASDTMTVDACAGFCNGAKFFGVEYGKECYCGGKLNDGSQIQPEMDCYMPCPGNSSEICGAGNRLNIYQSTITTTSTISTAPTPTPSSTDPNLAEYSYFGCLTDSVATRLLTGKATTSGANTYAACAAFCGGFQYFGVEYGAECYCGDVLNSITGSSGEKRPNDECNMDCSGDSTSSCGGSDRITVFQDVSKTDFPSNPTIPGYQYLGCHTDAVATRVLQGLGTSGPDMTIEKCSQTCTGFQYFGTEYGAECYCGNTFTNPTTKVAETDCSFVCSGNKLEFCGAGDRMTLYQKNPGQ